MSGKSKIGLKEAVAIGIGCMAGRGIFAIVNLVAFRKGSRIRASKIVTLFGFILCLAAFIILIVQQFQSNLLGISIALGIFIACF